VAIDGRSAAGKTTLADALALRVEALQPGGSRRCRLAFWDSFHTIEAHAFDFMSL